MQFFFTFSAKIWCFFAVLPRFLVKIKSLSWDRFVIWSAIGEPWGFYSCMWREILIFIGGGPSYLATQAYRSWVFLVFLLRRTNFLQFFNRILYARNRINFEMVHSSENLIWSIHVSRHDFVSNYTWDWFCSNNATESDLVILLVSNNNYFAVESCTV